MSLVIFSGVHDMDNGTYIIAEVGVNHNGDAELAKDLINVAVDSGANAVKFQTFVTEELVTPYARKSNYQSVNTNNYETSQYELLKPLEFSKKIFQSLHMHALSKGIDFISTPFDLVSVKLLKFICLSQVKVSSGDLTNYPLLNEITNGFEKIILSTGMATLEEVSDAVNFIKSKNFNLKNLILLHATSEYPCPFNEVNLSALKTLADHFDCPVGYSDHTRGIEVSLAAVAMGAQVIEKHVTLSRNLPGPDHRSSLEPDELCLLVNSIRNIELSFGDGIKKPSPSEVINMENSRKSLVAIQEIYPGEKFTIENLGTKRPGIGISASKYYEVLGTKSTRMFRENELISLS